jgi:hypothetical protein
LQAADGFAHMPDGVEKTRLAIALFGRSGKDMIPMLNLGSQAIRDMMDAADRLGVTISAQTSESLHVFGQRIHTMFA